MEQVTAFKTSDGEVFGSVAKAAEHELALTIHDAIKDEDDLDQLGRWELATRIAQRLAGEGLGKWQDKKWVPLGTHATSAEPLGTLSAATLKGMLVGTTPGPWNACGCDSCGLITTADKAGRVREILDRSLDCSDGSCIEDVRAQGARNKRVIAYLMNHAQEIVRLLEKR